MVLTGGNAGWRLRVRFAGGSAAVARSRSEVEALAQRNALDLIEAASSALSGLVLGRAMLPPTSAEQVCEAMAALGAHVTAYPTIGVVRCAWDELPSAEDLEALRALCATGQGAFVLEQAPFELKRRFDVWGTMGSDLSLMRRLKEQFDPQNILSPGRFVGGL
jgi:glycolate oxidase FAD binding subunit